MVPPMGGTGGMVPPVGGTGGTGAGGMAVECSEDSGDKCDGICVDLQTDPTHCGACGDDWPADLIEQGVTVGSSGIEVLCESAECVFACAEDPAIGPQQIVEDADHCGACGNVCETGINGLSAVCQGSACQCVLATGLKGVLCNDRCILDGATNCIDGCCPEVQSGATVQGMPIIGANFHQYQFELNTAQQADLDLRFDNGACPEEGGISLVQYRDDGLYTQIADTERLNAPEGQCAFFRVPLVPAGHYALVTKRALPAYTFDFTLSALAPLALPVDETIQVENQQMVVFEVATAGRYTVRVIPGQDAQCNGPSPVHLVTDTGEFSVLGGQNDCMGSFNDESTTELNPGIYAIRLTTLRLAGQYAIQIADAGPEVGDGISQTGTYPQEAIPVNSSRTLVLHLLQPQTVTLTTNGPDRDCFVGLDTILTLSRLGNEIASNDDIRDGLLCSQIQEELAADHYQIKIEGYDNAFVPPHVLEVLFE